MQAPQSITLDHEGVANESKHWVRLTAACNSKCIFCLDAEAQDGRFMSFDDICVEVRRGREEKEASRLVVSGGEATIHPRFHDVVRYAKSQGYRWVQTVTNGQRLADRDFFLRAVAAGLDEITFSLHGHTPELHDRLTKTKNGFENLMRAMIRAVRDGRVIVNVDVCINRQNVEHLEAIVALCSRVGVREFDLLHVIPQGEAFEHRSELFYDVDAHSEALRRVFRYARVPGFHIWTNRFPVQHLEGLEELIQDPHKMLDEVGGRRVQFRRYLDEGTPIDCRDARRCPHCFIEPFCSTLDRHIARAHAGNFDEFAVGADTALAVHAPPGVRWIGVSRLPEADVGPLRIPASAVPAGSTLPAGSRVVVESAAELPAARELGVELELRLDRDFASWLLENPAVLDDRTVLHAPTRAKASESLARDPDWRGFFLALGRRVRVENLPACLAPGTQLERAPRRLDTHLFHADGRWQIDAFVDEYVESHYYAKSLRCSACPVARSCRGQHLQSLRAHGFAQLQPLEGEWAIDATAQLLAWPDDEPDPRLAAGSPPQAPPFRIAVPETRPVPFIDTEAGRRS
jgi:MoaA/NifB/PqqE/SkfB family radical SAM enzyme